MLEDDGRVQFDTSKYLEILKKELRSVAMTLGHFEDHFPSQSHT